MARYRPGFHATWRGSELQQLAAFIQEALPLLFLRHATGLILIGLKLNHMETLSRLAIIRERGYLLSTAHLVGSLGATLRADFHIFGFAMMDMVRE
jgi:hypothetical protein